MMRILSLGAGVQSTTLALMAARGELPAPDAAIFADTRWEPRAVYDHLAWLERELPFPVYRVSKSDLRADVIASTNTTGGRFAAVPWYVRSDRGALGMGRRQCTKEYKLEPIYRKVRELVGPSRRARVEMWIGISTDEAHRMKPARRLYVVNRWPLIDLRMARRHCLAWLALHGYPEPPKSSCIGCPYHSDAHWREMRDAAPAEFADAVAVDTLIRDGGRSRGIRGQQFMHRSGVPLAIADLRTDAERGQPDLFGNECEGICGV